MTLNFWLFVIGSIVIAGIYIGMRRIEKSHHQRKLELLQKRLAEREQEHQ
jgi:hypothetical protein